MKRIAINMSKLSIGGMERALVDLINKSDLRKNYKIDLLIGYANEDRNYLKDLPNDINVKLLYKKKWGIKGKIIVALKLLFMLIFTKQYYCSICYTHHHGVLAKLTRKQSKNNIVFIHADIKATRTTNELNKLCNSMKFDKFSKIVCVSKKVKETFYMIYPNYKGKVVIANNYIDDKAIIDKSKEKIEEKKSKEITFLNVSRHEEETKRIFRILKSTQKLNKENYQFRVLLIGNGEDTIKYKEYVQKNNLNNVIFMGEKANPFPYYKISDAFVFSSYSEGYGIVLNESRVLNLPLIATDIADVKEIVDEGYGILCENSEEGIYRGMKKFLDEGYKNKKIFNPQEFNQKITKTINDIVK